MLYTGSVLYTLVFDTLMFRNLAIAEQKNNPELNVYHKYSLIISVFTVIYSSLHAALILLVINEGNARSVLTRWVFVIILDIGITIIDIGMTAIYILTL